MSVEFVDHCSVTLVGALASDDDVAMAAWVSHDQDSEERLQDRPKVKGLINFLYRNKHMSPFEHGIFKFKVDVPLFVAREFHRHRTFSYNEVSGRYTEMKPRFYLPSNTRPLRQEGKPGDYTFVEGTYGQYAMARANIEWAVEQSWQSYQNMLQEGIAKEVARMVLPVNLMTQFYATCNPRNLMQFLTLRNEEHALTEIQQVARDMEAHLAERMPFTYEAYRTARDRNTKTGVELVNEISVKSAMSPEQVTDTINAVQRSFNRREHVLA